MHSLRQITREQLSQILAKYHRWQGWIVAAGKPCQDTDGYPNGPLVTFFALRDADPWLADKYSLYELEDVAL